MAAKIYLTVSLMAILATACNDSKMTSGNQTPSATADHSISGDSSRASSTGTDGSMVTVANIADTADKFTSAELQAVTAHLEGAIPLEVTTIVAKIMANIPAKLFMPHMTFSNMAPYSALDSTKLTKVGDNISNLLIDGNVAKDGQQDPILQTEIGLNLVFLNGCLNQDSFLGKASCLLNLSHVQTSTDIGQSNLPGVDFKWVAGALTIDVTNALRGTGVLKKLAYTADLGDTAAKSLKVDLSSSAANDFAFNVPLASIVVHIDQIFAILDPSNTSNQPAITFDLKVQMTSAEAQGTVVINSKTDTLSIKINEPVIVDVHGAPNAAVQTQVSGVVQASLARHMTSVATLSPDPSNPLTVTVDINQFSKGAFDPTKLSNAVAIYGDASMETSLPDSSAIYQTLTCSVPESSPTNYNQYITEVVDNFGRMLETSYSWDATKFTGTAPGDVVKSICTIK